ncbi:MAG: universal stress protein [Arcanobacterium sp.]|nr:universal stress protein [Arcanobacterium sp.]
MTHENVVVVGTDGSEAAYSALEWGFAQALARKAELRIACVYELPSYAAHTISLGRTDIEAESRLLYEAAKSMVDELVARYANRGIPVSGVLLEGDASEKLVELSKTVALMVVGGRVNRHGGIAERILRTVSTALPAYSCCPTVVVPHEGYAEHLPIKRIAVGVDGSDGAKLALQRAIWEADRWGAELLVISAVNVEAYSGVPQFTLSKEYFDEVQAHLENQINEVSEGRKVKVSVIVTPGSPVSTLVKITDQVDLLILGTRGRGGFAGLLLGSTSQAILEHSMCPTFVVPRRVRPTDDVGPEIRSVTTADISEPKSEQSY